jgi:hypothetical protein
MIKSTDYREIANAALDAFWHIVAQRYPQAKTGDLSPSADMALQVAAEQAIAEWVSANVPHQCN